MIWLVILWILAIIGDYWHFWCISCKDRGKTKNDANISHNNNNIIDVSDDNIHHNIQIKSFLMDEMIELLLDF